MNILKLSHWIDLNNTKKRNNNFTRLQKCKSRWIKHENAFTAIAVLLNVFDEGVSFCLVFFFWFYNLWAVTCSCRPPDAPCRELLLELQQANSTTNQTEMKTKLCVWHYTVVLSALIPLHFVQFITRAWQSNSVYRTDYVLFQAKLPVFFSTVNLSRNFGSPCEFWAMLFIWFFSCMAQFSGVEGMT